MNGITERQREVLDHIRAFLDGHGYPPTIRELRNLLGIGSTNAVVCHLKALEKKGYLVRNRTVARGLKILRHE